MPQGSLALVLFNVYSSLMLKTHLLTAIFDPVKLNLDTLDIYDVDIIIIGSRGVSGIKRLFTGSISDKVSKHAACPVMIVR